MRGQVVLVAFVAAIIHLLGALTGGVPHHHAHDEAVVTATGHHLAADSNGSHADDHSHPGGHSQDDGRTHAEDHSHEDDHSHGEDASCGFAPGNGTVGVGGGVSLADSCGLVLEPIRAADVVRPTRAPSTSPPQLVKELKVIRV